jgi:membrane protein DedA with SNARE-associated domain/rhodanese-related sulfurtransferase
LLAGSIAAYSFWFGVWSLLMAVIAAMLADAAWYFAGRYYGQRILHLLCRISLSPDSCVRQTEGTFGQRGLFTLVLAKFIPGVSMLAPPMAGVMGVSRQVFFLCTALGTVLWAGVWMLIGEVFNHQVRHVLTTMLAFGKWALPVLATLLLIYVLYRIAQRYYMHMLGKIAKISVQEFASLMAQPVSPTVLDARSALSRELLEGRIQGAVFIDVEHLRDEIRQLPIAQRVVVYCACPNDVSALKVTAYLRRKGYQAHALSGGIEAWVSAGYQLEQHV